MHHAQPYVMIVEDDFAIREALTQILEDQGYLTESVSNGQEALDYLRRNSLPQLILLDLMMPVMNGHQFRMAQQQDARLAAVPVIVLSADNDAEIAATIEADGFLRKPVRLTTLVEVVGRYLSVADA
jgi:CheY-like chemotaxis protein